MALISIIAELGKNSEARSEQVMSLLPLKCVDVDFHIVSQLPIAPKNDAQNIRENITAITPGIIHGSHLEAINSSTSEILIFIGKNHSLCADAIDRIMKIVAQQPEISVWYATQVRVAHSSNAQNSVKLPHFSPERLLGDNYLRSGIIARRSAVMNAMSQLNELDQSALYELALRLTHEFPLVGHLRAPVFVQHSFDEVGEDGDIIEKSECEVVRRELNRRNVDAEVVTKRTGSRRVQRKIFHDPLVSIVIPTGCQTRHISGNNVLLVDQCVNSILNNSTYSNYEIVIIQDQTKIISDELLHWSNDQQVRVIPYSKEFNFADKCNVGFVQSKGDFVIFLNDDTTVLSPDWIETLIGHLQDVGVGLVGPTLLFEDGRVQSASLCNNPAPHNYGSGQSTEEFSALPHNRIAREVSGVTGACMAIRRDVYSEIGGMSTEFPNNFNDIDLCFKLLYKSYRIIWTPFAQLTHFEAQTRDPNVSEFESRLLRSRWGRFFNNDKFTPA